MSTDAIHALRLVTYTVEVNGVLVKIQAYDRAGAELAALATYGGLARVISGLRDTAAARTSTACLLADGQDHKTF